MISHAIPLAVVVFTTIVPLNLTRSLERCTTCHTTAGEGLLRCDVVIVAVIFFFLPSYSRILHFFSARQQNYRKKPNEMAEFQAGLDSFHTHGSFFLGSRLF